MSISAPEARHNLGCTIQSNDFASAQLTVVSAPQNVAKDSRKSFSEMMKTLRRQPWYFGGICWEEAENILQENQDGAFLVRDSANDRYIFTISFKSSSTKITHVRVPQHAGKFSFGSSVNSPHSSSDILDFIQSTISLSSDGSMDFLVYSKESTNAMQKLKLSIPVSKFKFSNLKNLCKEIILSRVKDEKSMELLPVSDKMKQFLKDTN